MQFKKWVCYAGWAAGIAGALLILLGVISFLFDLEIIGVRYFYNWFYIANSFIFLGIFGLIGGHYRECRQEKEHQD